jgi:hypothetical protein
VPSYLSNFDTESGCELALRLLLIERFSLRLSSKETTMTPEDTEQDRHRVAQKGKPDWVYIGSLVVIAISLLGMAFIFWARYGLER